MNLSQATKHVKSLCQIASQELNDQLKTAVNAKDTPADEESMHSDEARTLRKRRRINANVSADLVPTAQSDPSHQVQDGGNINEASMLKFCISH